MSNKNFYGTYGNGYYDYKNTGSSKCCNIIGTLGSTGPTGPQGNIGPTGPQGIAPSDSRDKTDIIELEPSLEFLKKLRPVRFTWNMRKNEEMRGQLDAGFIAQDMLETQETTGLHVPNLVIDEDPEYLLANYSKLIPIMAKAIQELELRVSKLELN